MKHDFPTLSARFKGIGYTHAPDGLPLVAVDRPVPQPGPDELLVHVVASSLICSIISSPTSTSLGERRRASSASMSPGSWLGSGVRSRGSRSATPSLA